MKAGFSENRVKKDKHLVMSSCVPGTVPISLINVPTF